tara:strand:+ start:538 stop:783 length:246 start_codon:yes stop_codon:yes gene_type:complete
MKALKKQFIGTGEVKGSKFTQIRSTKRTFLYEINTGYGVYYEVFIKVKKKRFEVISYPSFNYFGIWTYSKLEEAVNKFNTL